MNKLAKGLFFALVIAAPVVISAPTFKAEAATRHKTHHVVAKTHHVVAHRTNIVKHKQQQRYAKRHVNPKIHTN